MTAAAAALLLAGCGGGGKSSAAKGNGESAKPGPQVANDAASALEQSGAVHTKGTVRDNGKPGGLDLQLQGQDLSGTLTIDGQAIQVIAVGPDTWFQAPTAFWSSQGVPARLAPALGEKWVKIPDSQGEGGLTSQLSFAEVVKEIRSPSSGTITPQVRTGSFAGRPTVVVTGSGGSTIDVAATGQPYPLHVVEMGADGADITLDGFGVRQPIAAPPGALDLAALSS